MPLLMRYPEHLIMHEFLACPRGPDRRPTRLIGTAMSEPAARLGGRRCNQPSQSSDVTIRILGFPRSAPLETRKEDAQIELIL